MELTGAAMSVAPVLFDEYRKKHQSPLTQLRVRRVSTTRQHCGTLSPRTRVEREIYESLA